MMPEYQQPVERVVVALGTDSRRGLTANEARARLDRYGANELASPSPVRRWRRFLAQFEDVLVILLLVASAISAALWLYERDTALPFEAIAISAIVLLNAVIGYVQEARAETAIAALRQMSAERAHAIRDGNLRTIPASELVPGDLILIEAGDIVPAVLKDSEPISSDVALGDRINMVFKGTSVTSGRGYAVVVATGVRKSGRNAKKSARRRVFSHSVEGFAAATAPSLSNSSHVDPVGTAVAPPRR
jgi:Ca2+-transporting ATPase